MQLYNVVAYIVPQSLRRKRERMPLGKSSMLGEINKNNFSLLVLYRFLPLYTFYLSYVHQK